MRGYSRFRDLKDALESEGLTNTWKYCLAWCNLIVSRISQLGLNQFFMAWVFKRFFTEEHPDGHEIEVDNDKTLENDYRNILGTGFLSVKLKAYNFKGYKLDYNIAIS